jgi:4-amino-4-deoxy-L-arabinose transferase-like glycosyltransferase
MMHLHTTEEEAGAGHVAQQRGDAHGRVSWLEQLLEPAPPQQRRSDGYAIVLFVLSALYLLLFRRYTTMDPDEGIILQGAQRILQGQVLYRDFFSFFTPGSYYLYALLFKVFGSSIVVARTALAVIGAGCSVISYLLVSRVCSRATGILLAILLTLTTLPYRFLVLHNWDSTLWACLALYGAVRMLEAPSWKWATALGSFVSLAILFEQSKGAGLGAGLALGYFVIAAFGGENKLWTTKSMAGLIAGLLWPLAVTGAYFILQGGFSAMLADLAWPFQHYSTANRVPYGYQNWGPETQHQLFGTGALPIRVVTVLALSPCFVGVVLPLLAFPLLAYWTVKLRRAAASCPEAPYYIVISAVLLGLLASVVAVRADVVHFVYLQPLFLLILAWIADGRGMPLSHLKNLRLLLGVLGLCGWFLMGAALFAGRAGLASNLITRRGSVITPSPDSVVPYFREHVKPGEPVLVYPYLPLYYYLTDTESPSRYEYFQPGMNTREQAREIVSALDSKRVRVVLYEASFAKKIPTSWPGTPVSAVANDAVANYIVREYQTCAELRSPSDWRFHFMVRKDSRCP